IYGLKEESGANVDWTAKGLNAGDVITVQGKYTLYTGKDGMFDLHTGHIPIIYVPTESVEAYKTAEYWSEYADYIEPYQFE
ncbi:MAG: hypothetical protein IJZ09_03280, partial [Tidjanibacter sp.]|nr:hypothetical protein [Tidjanibacter sp.]